MVPFSSVIAGLAKYLDRHVYSGMSDWQEVLARVSVGRILGNEDVLKQQLLSNGFLKTFCIMDAEGNVDVDRLVDDIKREISRKEKIRVQVPVLGTFVFSASDVDEIRAYILEGSHERN